MRDGLPCLSTVAAFFLLLGAQFAAGPVATAGADTTAAKPPACAEDDKPIDYAKKADLPAGVIEAFGFPMAEVGEPFQVTDVIIKKGLPLERFISARQTGCRLKLNFERGGIAHRYENVEFELKDGKWTLAKP